MKPLRLTACFALALLFVSAPCHASLEQKTRLIVLTDIGGDPDDQESMVRLLMYSNEFEIEGLIATARMRHGRDTRPDLIRQLVSAYAEVRPNLLLHRADYPSAQHLLDCIKSGQPVAGPAIPVDESIGAGKDTEASEWIVNVVDKPDSRPLWVTVWGGTADLAQALWKVARTRNATQQRAFKSKLRVYAISDQDSTGPWIRANHPDLFYIAPKHCYRGMYRDGDTSFVTREWVTANVNSKGPLGALYPNYDGGDPWGKVQGVKEGDTPSFLYLIPNGLNDPEQPSWGSWGGRFSGGPQFEDAKDTVGNENSERAAVHRWRSAYQNSFAARMNWCVRPVREANHEPVAAVKGELRRTVTSGATVDLDASLSRDIDGQPLSFQWMFYREPSSFAGTMAIEHSDQAHARFVAPRVSEPQTIHIVLTVTDTGTPALSSYCRVVITVTPVKSRQLEESSLRLHQEE